MHDRYFQLVYVPPLFLFFGPQLFSLRRFKNIIRHCGRIMHYGISVVHLDPKRNHSRKPRIRAPRNQVLPQDLILNSRTPSVVFQKVSNPD